MPDVFSEEALENYYRKEPLATEKAILSFLRDTRNPHMIVFGAQAVNAHLPDWLDKATKDWDIVTIGNAKELANKLEGMLDRHYGGDFFKIEPALHPGTFKIKSKVTGSTVADITLKDREIDFKRLKGVNYADLDWLEKEAEKLIANPEAAFRKDKDMDTLQRIRVFKRFTGRAGRGTRQQPSRMRRSSVLSRSSKSSRLSGRYIDGSLVDTSMRGFR